MEVTGTLKAKFDTQKVSDRFQKRDFVLTTEANTPYPQHVNFQITQDKCALLDQYNVGAELRVHFNLRGREWNGPEGAKYFNTLEAWRVELVHSEPVSNSAPASQPTQSAPSNNESDDLPF